MGSSLLSRTTGWTWWVWGTRAQLRRSVCHWYCDLEKKTGLLLNWIRTDLFINCLQEKCSMYENTEASEIVNLCIRRLQTLLRNVICEFYDTNLMKMLWNFVALCWDYNPKQIHIRQIKTNKTSYSSRTIEMASYKSQQEWENLVHTALGIHSFNFLSSFYHFQLFQCSPLWKFVGVINCKWAVNQPWTCLVIYVWLACINVCL